MDFQRSNVIGVRLKLLDLFHGIVVEDTQAHVIGGCQEPLLAGQKLGAADGEIAELEGLDANARLIIPDHDIARIQGSEDPWFRGVNVHGLDAL